MPFGVCLQGVEVDIWVWSELILGGHNRVRIDIKLKSMTLDII